MAFVAMAILGFLGVLSMLYVCATRVRSEVQVHDLRVKVTHLRADQIRRLRALAEVTLEARGVKLDRSKQAA
jgi:hypothetical protein